MAPLRWGIASAGKISNDFCAALSTLPEDDHKVVAVAARSESSAKEFADTFGIAKFYCGYEKLAADSDVDAVYIGAINTAHLDIGLMMVNAGKHVLCEKPLTLNEKGSKKLLDAAKAKKVFVLEAIWSRFFPSYQHLRSRLDNKDLGDIKEVDVEFGFELQTIDRLTKKDMGGGTVLDLGVYTIQFAQFVFGTEPVSITAKGKVNDDGVDIETEVEMKYASGGVARFRTSALKELENKANIRGSKAFMTLHSFWCPTYLTDTDTNLKEWPLPKPKRGSFNFHNSAGLRYEAEEMRRCIKAGLLECPLVTHEQSLIIARIQDEIRRQLGVKFPEDDE